MRWLDFIFPPRVDETLLRTVPRDEFIRLAAPHAINVTRPVTTALLPYPDERVRSAIHEAKYHGSRKAFALLGVALAAQLATADADTRVVAVPLSARRERERGFNQVAEIARAGGIVLETGLLVRTRETASQVSLPREAREANMRDAFSAARPASPAHTYVLLDDVVTTGATMQAAIDALEAAGATRIVPLALAH